MHDPLLQRCRRSALRSPTVRAKATYTSAVVDQAVRTHDHRMLFARLQQRMTHWLEQIAPRMKHYNTGVGALFRCAVAMAQRQPTSFVVSCGCAQQVVGAFLYTASGRLQARGTCT